MNDTLTTMTDTELDAAFADAFHHCRAADVDRLAAEIDRRETAADARLRAPGALAAAAHWYAARGLPVFPLVPRGKRPVTRHGVKDATLDRDQIARWWHETPAANIGVATGHRVDVIDIDGPPGYTSLATMHANRIVPHVLGIVGTAGDRGRDRPRGQHLYVATTGVRRNSAKRLPGIDTRGVGGYVVAPPSIGPDGTRYSWIEPLRLPETPEPRPAAAPHPTLFATAS